MEPEDLDYAETELIIWPGEEASEGDSLAGYIDQYDPTGGEGATGFLDVVNKAGDRIRFYLNGPARTGLEAAAKAASAQITPEDLKSRGIRIRFNGWQTSKRGRDYRDFSVGLGAHLPAPQEEQADSEEGA